MMRLWRNIRLLWSIFLHKEAPWSVKFLLIAGFLYIIFPMDIFPDQILLAGWLDDLVLAVVMYILAMKITPEDLIKKLLAKFGTDEIERDDKQ